MEYKCSKHCTVLGAVLFVDDHWLLLGSWLCVLSGERERERERGGEGRREGGREGGRLSTIQQHWSGLPLPLPRVVDLEPCLQRCPGSSVGRELCLS